MKQKTLIACLVLLMALPAIARRASDWGDHSRTKPQAAATIDFSTYINANKILMFVTNKGSFAYDNGTLFGKADGMYYPYTSVEDILDGSNKLSVIYAGSVWMGAIDSASGDTLVTSGQHDTDWGIGPLDSIGSPPSDPESNLSYRVYKLYSDSLADNPNTDYLEWPVEFGAPWDTTDAGDTIPAMMGEQMLWSVTNDNDPIYHVGDAGTVGKGLGIEMRQTTFAFSGQGALSNIVFMKMALYNKGGKTLTNMYISLWSDPDLGDASDDYVGCDTILSLGYCYNATASDNSYGSKPPATGYDFFQGPLFETGVQSDFGRAWGQLWPGFVNLELSSFNKYVNPNGPDVALESYRFMTGLTKDGSPLLDHNGNVTKFFGYGDPTTGSGYLDAAPADRRFMQSVGPFTFRPGDSTELIVAILAAQGKDRLNSITQLKAVDAFAQKVYENNFVLPSPPADPDLSFVELDGEVLLTWGSNSEQHPGSYPFEGYAVLSGPTTNGPWDTLAWFDLENGIKGVFDYVVDPVDNPLAVELLLKPGLDNGLTHSLLVTADAVGTPLANYSDYIFRVEAYSVDIGGPVTERVLTSDGSVIKATPHPQMGGTDYTTIEPGSTFEVTHTATVGTVSGGSVTVEVTDPGALTGHDYTVTFGVIPPDTGYWNLNDVTAGTTVLSKQTNQTGEGLYLIADGLRVVVAGPVPGFLSFEVVANGAGVIDPPESGAAPWAGFPVPTGVDVDGYPTDGQQEGDGHWFFHTGDNGGTAGGGTRGDFDSFVARTLRVADDGGARRDRLGAYDWEMRFTGDNATPGTGGSWGWAPTAFGLSGDAFWVPFELWRTGIGTPNDASDDVQCAPYIFTDGGDTLYYMSSYGSDADATCGPGGCEHSVSGGDNDPYTDWVYWAIPNDQTPGTAGYDAFETAIRADGANYPYATNESNVMDRTVLCNWNGGVLPPFNQALPEQGTVFRIRTAKPNTSADIFAFTAEALGELPDPADLLELVSAVPNPYYLFSDYDNSTYNKLMKFTNLPTKCTINIFTLGGDQVRRLWKNDDLTYVEWDLLNEANIPLASGMYIYVVDAPGIGEKVGKMAIFTEKEVLDQF